MPTVNNHPGLGTSLKIATVVTAQVTEISGPSFEVGTRETTTLTSTAKTYAPTLLDGGEINFTVQYDTFDASQAALTTLLSSPAVVACELDFIDGGKVAFSAILTKFEPGGMAPEDTVTADVTLKLTGGLTFTAHS